MSVERPKLKEELYSQSSIEDHMNYSLFKRFKSAIAVYIKIMSGLNDPDVIMSGFTIPEKNTNEIIEEYKVLIVDEMYERGYQRRRINTKVYNVLFRELEEQLEDAQTDMYKQLKKGE